MTVIILVLCYNKNTEGFTHLKGVLIQKTMPLNNIDWYENDKDSTGEDIQYYNT